MKYLFSPSGKRFLDSLPLAETLFAFDFDGTLAPIAAFPDQASIPPETRELLAMLGDQAVTAVISGRSLSDLRGKLRFFRGRLVGNHGLEGLSPRASFARTARTVCKEWKDRITEKERDSFSLPGVALEDKIYSLSLHYRQSASKQRTLSALMEASRRLIPQPRIIPGKSVINLVPAGAPHKGDALRFIMSQLGKKQALYVGDDETDRDVYSVPDTRITSVFVGGKRGSEAQFYVRRQTEVNQILKRLLDRRRVGKD